MLLSPGLKSSTYWCVRLSSEREKVATIYPPIFASFLLDPAHSYKWFLFCISIFCFSFHYISPLSLYIHLKPCLSKWISLSTSYLKLLISRKTWVSLPWTILSLHPITLLPIHLLIVSPAQQTTVWIMLL